MISFPKTTVHDVAAYILQRAGQMSSMKMQKLAYYSQAWSLVWDGRPLFREPIEAWANGPVCRALFSKHRGQFLLERWPSGNSNALNPEQQATINAVIQHYGDKAPHWLSELTHMEAPWQEARVGIPVGQRCDQPITLESMYSYYSAI